MVTLAALLASIALGVSLYLSFYGGIPSDTAFLLVRITLVVWLVLTIVALAKHRRRGIRIFAVAIPVLAWFIYLYHDCMARNVCP